MERKFDLKDALKSGVTPEQMIEDFKKQLTQAQHEVSMERSAANKLNKAREDLIDAIMVYATECGLTLPDTIDTTDLKKEIKEVLKDMEKEITAVKPLLETLQKVGAKEKEKSKTPDDVIENFLKSLV